MNKGDPVVSSRTCAIVALVFFSGLLQLGFALYRIQVDSAASYNYASARQSVRRVRTSGGRGRILDRHGVVLADNRPSMSVVCDPAGFQARTWDETVGRISESIAAVGETIGRPSTLTVGQIRRHVNQSLAMPIFVWRDLDDDELARFAEHEGEHHSFSIVETEERVYPQGTLAAHLLGFVGRDRGEGLAGDEKFSFFLPEPCGRSGVELHYDGFLRGVSGERKLLVDARGFTVRSWTVVEERRGPDLVLALDAKIQREAERQLADVCGSCVVLDPRTGDVLTMASSPGFNPNDFVPVLRSDFYDRLVRDPAKPLLNRATGGAYAPGSTFKPVTALAGLTAGYPDRAVYDCNGVFVLADLRLHCARRWGHGEQDLRHALMNSCNPFFCNLAVEIGTEALVEAARAFGLGARTGLDFGMERMGLVPDADAKMRSHGEPWYPGDLAQMAIGQGLLLVTPLQMARVAGALGTGFLVTPHLKAGVRPERQPLPFDVSHLQAVREGMRLVVAGDGETRGSGWRGGEGVAVPVSGKTGTAEVGSGETRRKNTWFIAYAPSEAPTVAVALVVERGESGGLTAAPRVAAILKRIFGGAGS